LQEHLGASAARDFDDGLTLNAVTFTDGDDPFSSQVESQ
jgi:hypothetical protein